MLGDDINHFLVFLLLSLSSPQPDFSASFGESHTEPFYFITSYQATQLSHLPSFLKLDVTYKGLDSNLWRHAADVAG